MEVLIGILFGLLVAFLVCWISRGMILELLILRALKRRLPHFLPNAAFIVNNPFAVVGCNRYDIELFPFLREEIIGSNLWDLLPAEITSRIYKGYRDTVNTGKIRTIKLFIMLDTMERMELELRFVPLSRCKYIVAIFRIVEN